MNTASTHTPKPTSAYLAIKESQTGMKCVILEDIFVKTYLTLLPWTFVHLAYKASVRKTTNIHEY